MQVLKKICLFFLLIHANSIFAQEVSVHIIDETNFNQAESLIYIDEAFLLFKTLHEAYADTYSVEMVEHLFNSQINCVKSGHARLFLALSDNKIIGNIFAVYNEARHMTQLRFLGFDQNLSQESCLNAFEEIIKKIQKLEPATSKGICCVTNKKIVNYLWLLEKLNLMKNPSLFREDNFDSKNYYWYSRYYIAFNKLHPQAS